MKHETKTENRLTHTNTHAHVANKTIDSKTHLNTACVAKTGQKEFELK